MLGAAGAVAVASLLPAVYLLLREGFSFGLLRKELSAPSTGPLIWNTVQLVFLVTTSCVVLGVGLGLLVSRTDLPLRRMWTVLLTLPLGVPTFVGSYAWVAASYRLFPKSTFLYGLRGSVIVLSLSLFPYVFLPVVVALRGLNPAQEEAARSVGHGAAAAFLRVTLPQLRVAIAGGSLIISLHLLAEFGALQMLRFQTLTTAVVNRATVLGAPEAARALAVVLAVAALVLLVLDRILRGRAQAPRTQGGAPRPPDLWRLGGSRWIWMLTCGAVVAVALGVPLYATFAGLAAHASGSVSGVDWSLLWHSTANTARYGLAAALVATAAALPVSLLSVRYPGKLASAFERSTWVAHALPGVIMALALVYVSVRWVYPIYQTSTLLIIAYAIMFLPLAIGSQQVGFSQASTDYDDLSRSLGSGPLRTFTRVTLPLVLPAIAAGAMLVALDVGKELTTTLLLHPTGEYTLATALWGTTNGEVLDFSAAAPYGLALLMIGAVPAVLLARRTLRS